MKLKIIAREEPVGPWLAVEDDKGNRLPGVRHVELIQDIRQAPILRLELVVDGRDIELVTTPRK